MEWQAIRIAVIGALSFAIVALPLKVTAPQLDQFSPWTSAFIEEALSHSPTYREILRWSDRPEVYAEDRNLAFLELAIGCDVEISEKVHRFERWATLRLFRDGAISKEGYDSDMEYQWESEYRP